VTVFDINRSSSRVWRRWSPTPRRAKVSQLVITTFARVTQEAAETLVTANPNARVTQEAVEALVTASNNARVTQEAVELLVVPQAVGFVTQAGIEPVIQTISDGRVTQAGIEVINSDAVNGRITQAGIEVVVPQSLALTVFPTKATAGAITKGPTVQTLGGAIVIPTIAKMGAVSVPGPHWSYSLFGALSRVGIKALPVPDPSYDIRPAHSRAGAVVVNPWLGAPFNANDNFVGATVIPNTVSSGTPYSIRGNTGGFSLEAGEPQPKSGNVSATGWFTFTPTVSGYYQFNLAGSTYSTSVAVYQQSGTGITGLTEVGSNQSVKETNVYVFLTAGQQYWVQVATQGSGGVGNTFQLVTSFVSATCNPVQCEGSMTANFWSGWSGGAVSVVGGFGGFPEVARARCPSSWTTITTFLTLDSSTNKSDIWQLCWEIHDIHDNLLGGRGGFFTGPDGGLSSWQDREPCGVGQTVSTTFAYHVAIGGGGDTTFAYWFVFYAFPFTINTLSGHMHAQASFGGTCPIVGASLARSWAWWA
jgi:hypothetical protein